jgi:hypothetical protein
MTLMDAYTGYENKEETLSGTFRGRLRSVDPWNR